jgi:hypothetical protein
MIVATLARQLPLVTVGLVLGLTSLSGLPAQAASIKTVVNFDDLPGDNAGINVPVPDGYGGIIWNKQWNHFGTPQFPYTPASGSKRAYTRQPQAAFFFQTAPVIFNGAFFSGFNVSAPRFELFLQGQLVHSSQALQISGIPTFLDSGFSGLVDEVRVIQNHDFSAYVIDDVTYTTVSTIPSPALLPGLIGVGVALWRKKSA